MSTLGATDQVAFGVALAASALFFGSILLHELGHAFAARREGIDVAGIDLFLFGGVMKMNRDTDSPGAEFRVAAAGPLVTLGIVILGGLLTIVIAGSDRLFNAGSLSGDQSEDIPVVLLSVLVGFNVVLLLFNLIPAFPLDGGRDRPRRRLEDHGRPRQGDPLLGAARAGLRRADDRLRHLHARRGRHLGPVDDHARLAAGLRGALGDSPERVHRPARGDHRRPR